MKNQPPKPLHAGQVLRAFAKCFSDRKQRARYPYAMIDGDTIIASDSYIILKYQHHMPIIDGTAYAKLEHTGQFSDKDDLILDGEHLQGTASGLLIPVQIEPVKLFKNVEALNSREFERFASNPDPVSDFLINTELLSNAIAAFDKLGFSGVHLFFDTRERPMGIEAVKHLCYDSSTVTVYLSALVNYMREV